MRKYVMLVTFTLAVLCWIGVSPVLAAMSATEVEVKQAVLEPTVSSVQCSGTVLAASQQTVSYGTPVMPSEVLVRVGDSVRKGQLLMRIDTVQTAQAFAAIQGVSQGADNSAAATAAAAGAAAYGAGQAAGDQQSISELLTQYYAQQKQAGDTDSNTSDNQTDDTGNPAEIPQEIYASTDGIVTELAAIQDTFTQPTVPMIVISDLSCLQVKAQVDEGLVAKVAQGQMAEISGSGNGVYKGRVTRVYPTARTVITSNSVKTVVDVLVELESTGSGLKPGMSADLTIITAQSRAIRMPYEAVRQDDDNQEYVLVLRGGKACRQDVTTGAEHTEDLEITGGLREGEMVIVGSRAALRNGQSVRAPG